MVRIYILRVGLAFLVILLMGKASKTRADEGASVQQSITDAQAALRHRHYSQASQTLEDALNRFPGNLQLRLELGRASMHHPHDSRTITVFPPIHHQNPP